MGKNYLFLFFLFSVPLFINIIAGQSCFSSCLTCSGNTSTDCLTCDPATSFYWEDNKSCWASCPEGSFTDPNLADHCLSCLPGCKTCQDSTTCLTCDQQGAIKYFDTHTSTCIATCPTSNYFESSQNPFTCSPCDGSCLTCSGTLSSNCNSCHPTGNIYLYSNTCYLNCPSRTYSVGNICGDCDSSCLSCTGGTPNDCVMCDINSPDHDYFYSNTCVADCPQKTFISNKICGDCHNSCLTCTGNSENHCSTCEPAAPYFWPDQSSCWLACPDGSFPNVNVAYSCLSCLGSCKTCQNEVECLTCDQNGSTKYLDLRNNLCVASCPTGTYQSNDNPFTCSACHNSCSTCNSGQSTGCLTCDQQGTNKYFETSTNTCNPSCPSTNYYEASQSPYTCSPCHPDCLTCSGTLDTNCNSCQVNGKMYLFSNSCYASCPLLTYQSGFACYSCHSSCVSCSGTSFNNCLTCNTNNPNSAYFYSNTCLSSCPQKSYLSNNAAKICTACYANCLSCMGSYENQCITCDPSTPYFWTERSSCWATCPDGSYPDPNSANTCLSCLSSCKTCQNGANCVTCDQNGSTKYKNLITNMCEASCPSDTYESNNNPFTCSACHPFCLSCTSGLSTSCKSCNINDTNHGYLFQNECIAACPSNSYISSVLDKICTICHSSCLTCNGDTANNCASCKINDPSNSYFFQQTCYSTCPPGSYISDQVNQICSICDSNCLTCSAGTANDCLSCKPSRPLYWSDRKTCYTICPDGSYVGGVNICLTCLPTCLTCGNGITCTTCDLSGGTPYFNTLNNYCTSVCPAGTYISNPISKFCSTCDVTCMTCNGGLSTDCLSCNLANVNTNYLYNNQCFSSCPTDTFILDSSLKTCSACHISCSACSGPLSTNCLACNPLTPFYWQDKGTCTNICPTGSYLSSTNICTSCHASCASCNEAGFNKCLTCKIPSTFAYFYVGTCYTTCPSGTFISDLVNKLCAPCSSSCLTCDGAGATSCLSCDVSNPNWAWYANKGCYASCPIWSFISNSANKICTTCHASCKTCDQASSNNCLTCDVNGQYPWYYDTLRSCNQVCPAGTAGKVSDNKCYACDTTCKTCDKEFSPTDCLSCNTSSSSYGYYISNQKVCLSACLIGTYLSSPITKVCIICQASCKTCDGGSATDCLSCDTQSSTTSYFFQKTCNPSCPDGSWLSNSGSKLCSICDTSCSKCSTGNANSCLSCSTSKWFWSSQGTCTDFCSPGSFPTGMNTFVCQSCHSDCLTCDGGASNNCLSCLSSGSNPWYFDSAHSCTNVCPNVSYASDNVNFICSPCHSTCKTCNGNTSQNCLSCDPLNLNNNLLLVNVCTNNCPPPYYPDYPNAKCFTCDPTCLICNGPGSNECVTCDSQTPWLWADNNSCHLSCPSGSYISDQSLKKCSSCDLSCETCDGGSSTNCLTCNQSGTFPWFMADLKSCYTDCQTYFGYISNQNTKECGRCNSLCKLCDGPTANDCLQCNLMNNNYDYFYNKACYPDCPAKTFISDAILKICSSCHMTCNSCSGSNSNNCITCNNNTPWFLNTVNTCHSTCPSNSYPSDPANKLCDLCDGSCLTCSGPAQTNCLSCKPDNPYFFEGSATCGMNCPTNGYLKDAINKICGICDFSCLTCSGPSSNDCITCNLLSTSSKFLYAGTCGASCPNGKYGDLSTSFVCTACNSKCLTCSAAGPNGCLSCDPLGTFTLYIPNQKTCVTSCPNSGFYYDQGSLSCKACHISCYTCGLSAAINSCLSCNTQGTTPWYNLNQSTCSAKCAPNSYIFSSVDKTCANCHGDCLTCSGPSQNECLSCNLMSANLSWQYITKCLSACPDGTYINNPALKLCLDCHQSCALCSKGTAADCLTCQPGLYFLKNTCNVDCPEYYYKNEISFNCDPCNDANCKQCTQSKCLICKSGFTVNPLNDHCTQCDVTCLECSGLTNQNCTSCLSGSVLYKNECLGGCPKGTYLQGSICKGCDSSCANCDGNSRNSCLSCIEGYFLSITTKECFICESPCRLCKENTKICTDCIDNFYLANKNGLCSPCSEGCKTCSGPNPDACKSCLSDYSFHQSKYCLIDCPDNFFSDSKQICVPCYKTCKTCKDPGDQSCLSCRDGFFLLGSICQASCPEEDYPDEDSRTCEKKQPIFIKIAPLRNPTIFKIGLTIVEKNADALISYIVSEGKVTIPSLGEQYYTSRISKSEGEDGVAYIYFSYSGIPKLEGLNFLLVVGNTTVKEEKFFYDYKKEGYTYQLKNLTQFDCNRSSSEFVFETQRCTPPYKLDFSLSYTQKFEEILMSFNMQAPNFFAVMKTFMAVGLSPNRKLLSSNTITKVDNMTFLIKLNFSSLPDTVEILSVKIAVPEIIAIMDELESVSITHAIDLHNISPLVSMFKITDGILYCGAATFAGLIHFGSPMNVFTAVGVTSMYSYMIMDLDKIVNKTKPIATKKKKKRILQVNQSFNEPHDILQFNEKINLPTNLQRMGISAYFIENIDVPLMSTTVSSFFFGIVYQIFWEFYFKRRPWTKMTSFMKILQPFFVWNLFFFLLTIFVQKLVFYLLISLYVGANQSEYGRFNYYFAIVLVPTLALGLLVQAFLVVQRIMYYFSKEIEVSNQSDECPKNDLESKIKSESPLTPETSAAYKMTEPTKPKKNIKFIQRNPKTIFPLESFVMDNRGELVNVPNMVNTRRSMKVTPLPEKIRENDTFSLTKSGLSISQSHSFLSESAMTQDDINPLSPDTGNIEELFTSPVQDLHTNDFNSEPGEVKDPDITIGTNELKDYSVPSESTIRVVEGKSKLGARIKAFILKLLTIEDIESFLDRYSLFIFGLRSNSIFSRYCFILYLIRYWALNALLVFLNEQVLYQLISILSLNALFLLYAIIVRPYDRSLNNLLCIFSECILVVCATFLFLIYGGHQKARLESGFMVASQFLNIVILINIMVKIYWAIKDR